MTPSHEPGEAGYFGAHQPLPSRESVQRCQVEPPSPAQPSPVQPRPARRGPDRASSAIEPLLDAVLHRRSVFTEVALEAAQEEHRHPPEQASGSSARLSSSPFGSYPPPTPSLVSEAPTVH